MGTRCPTFGKPPVLFDNTGGQSGVLDTPAPVAQDVHLSARAWLDEFAVCYSSTGSSPGSMMVRFFDGGADGSAVPLYPEGLIEEYNLGQLSWTGSGSACKTTDLLPPLLMPSHIWMEVEIDQNAGVVLGGAPAEVGFTQGLVYDRDAGQMLSGPLYLSFTLLGVVCFDDCNANGLQDACDLSCGPSGGPCDLPGCGQSADGNGNGVPDECESAGPDGDGDVDFDDSARFRSVPRG